MTIFSVFSVVVTRYEIYIPSLQVFGGHKKKHENPVNLGFFSSVSFACISCCSIAFRFSLVLFVFYCFGWIPIPCMFHLCSIAKCILFLVYVARSGRITFDVLRDHFCLPIALIPTTAAIRDAPENSDISVRAVYSCPESHVICNFYVGLIFDDEQKKAVEAVQKALCFQKQVRCVSF